MIIKPLKIVQKLQLNSLTILWLYFFDLKKLIKHFIVVLLKKLIKHFIVMTFLVLNDSY